VIWLILRALWAGPIRSDATSFFKDRPPQPWSAWSVMWFVAAVALPVAVVVWVALNLVGGAGMWLFLGSAAVVAFAASLAVVTVLSAGGVRLYEASPQA